MWTRNVPSFNIYDLLKYKRQRLVKAIEAITTVLSSMVTKVDQLRGYVNPRLLRFTLFVPYQSCLGKCLIEILHLGNISRV